ncbi:hypothetical protein Ocin01_10843 [Orchesella cincta]|uniref:Uncharacterized protein n=1 Tax=Orchesella cincta TaxID=48709 RepID=A0A1D2MRY8_ORCCI|nr:hypothetical protein Ocin01_10843 [Orchesella cincta]
MILSQNFQRFSSYQTNSKMCTNWSTRNRAVVNNHYAVQTLLLNKDAYCPCGPNRQDYTYRSRLYNPDPKYQCHLDLTCHMFDSIPKATSCSGYGSPNIYNQTVSAGAGSSCMSSSSSTNGRPPRCKRRRVRAENCCVPKPDLCSLVMCCTEPAPCCEEQPNECDTTNNAAVAEEECCYELPQPTENCNDSVTYDCGPCGEVCSVKLPGGNQFEMPSSGRICLESGCSNDNPRIRIKSCVPCCPPPTCVPCSPFCPPSCCGPCSPPPRRALRCSTRNICKKTTVGPSLGCCFQCLECRPRFRNPNLSPRQSNTFVKQTSSHKNALGSQYPTYNHCPIASNSNLLPDKNHDSTSNERTPGGSRKGSPENATLEESKSNSQIPNIFYQPPTAYYQENQPISYFEDIASASNGHVQRYHYSARDGDNNNSRWKERSHLHNKCSVQNISRRPSVTFSQQHMPMERERIENESHSDAQCYYRRYQSQCQEPTMTPTNKVRSRFTESSYAKRNYGTSCNYGVPPNVLQELAELQNSSQARDNNGGGDKDISMQPKLDQQQYEQDKDNCLESLGLVRIPSVVHDSTRAPSSRNSMGSLRQHLPGLPFAETAWVVDPIEIKRTQQPSDTHCQDTYSHYSDSASYSYTNQPSSSYYNSTRKETLVSYPRRKPIIDFSRLESQMITEHQASFLPPRCNELIQKAKRAQRLALARNLYLNPAYGRPKWNTSPRPQPQEPYESLAAAEAKLSALDEGYYFPYENQPSVYTMARAYMR